MSVFLIERGRTTEALQVADFSRAQTLLEGLGALPKQTSFHPARVNPQQVAQAMHGIVLFYWLSPDRSYLWAVTSRQTRLFQLPPKAEIEELVQKYNRALLGPSDVLETQNSAGY